LSGFKGSGTRKPKYNKTMQKIATKVFVWASSEQVIIDYILKTYPLLEQNKNLPEQAFANAIRDIIIHERSLTQEK